MLDSSGAFIKASLEMHVLITSPSERFGISMCSMVLQKQQIKNVKHPPFILVQNEATMHRNLFVLDLAYFDFLPLNYPSDPRS